MGYDRRPIIVPIGPSIAYVPMTRGQYALIDSEDAEEVGRDNWFSSWSRFTKSFYPRRCAIKAHWREQSLHRLLLWAPDGMVVDHINRNTLDNRKSNLRVVTRSGNALNRKPSIRAIPTGIMWHKQSQRWEARIVRRPLRKYVGRFRLLEQAVAARELELNKMQWHQEG
jgi:hypothetical protein